MRLGPEVRTLVSYARDPGSTPGAATTNVEASTRLRAATRPKLNWPSSGLQNRRMQVRILPDVHNPTGP